MRNVNFVCCQSRILNLVVYLFFSILSAQIIFFKMYLFFSASTKQSLVLLCFLAVIHSNCQSIDRRTCTHWPLYSYSKGLLVGINSQSASQMEATRCIQDCGHDDRLKFKTCIVLGEKVNSVNLNDVNMAGGEREASYLTECFPNCYFTGRLMAGIVGDPHIMCK